MTETRRTFSKEFTLQTVKLSYERQNMRELAHEPEIRPELLCRWRKEFASKETSSFTGNGKKKTGLDENARLSSV